MIWHARTVCTYVSAAAPIGDENGNPLLDSALRIGVAEVLNQLTGEAREEYRQSVEGLIDSAKSEKKSEDKQRMPEPKVGSFEAFMSTFGRVAQR